MPNPRIITLDIETAPMEAYVWGLFEVNPGLEMLATEWSILSFSYKVLGEKKVHFYSTGGRGAKKVRDDRLLCAVLWKVLDEADIVVGQNIRRFDLPKIRARLIELGFPPFSPVRVIDTMKMAKQVASFTSNKLAWLSKHLTPEVPKDEHKKYPGFKLWSACLRDEAAAWREMALYNKRDVLATEAVYTRLNPWADSGAHLGGDGCPRCGLGPMQKRGWNFSQAGSYQRFQCAACGGWSSDKKLQNRNTYKVVR